MSLLKCHILPLVIVATLLAPARSDSNWNQFRGPTADGHGDAKGLPITFGEQENVKWKIEVPGKAWSSPVVWGKQIWLTNAPADGKKLFAMCVDLETGKLIHYTEVFDNPNPQTSPVAMNSYASPTPFIEQDRVYVSFGAHGTACLDTATGKPLWTRRDLECNHFRLPASSPIVHRDLLYMHFDGYDQQYVVALNKLDGTTAWKKHREIDFGKLDGDNRKAYGTPALIEFDGRQQLICPAAVGTEAFDPKSGSLLWSVRHGGMNASARPLLGHGLVFITNGMGAMVAVRPNGSGDVTQFGIAWQSNKQIPKKPSFLLIGDLLFLIADSGVASRVDAKTGEIVGSQRLGGDFSASPVYADGRIYCCNEQGSIFVLAPERDLKLLATNKLDSGFMASPAVAANSLILRTKTHLYRVAK